MLTSAAWAETRLGHRFADAALLDAALTHRSAGRQNYERLEFLGDSVLNFTVAVLVYRAFPDADEGDLSRYRATLVSGQSLADVANGLALGDQLRLGSGELKTGGFRRDSGDQSTGSSNAKVSVVAIMPSGPTSIGVDGPSDATVVHWPGSPSSRAPWK